MISREKAFLYKEIVEGLHREWNPHAGQIKAARALFIEGKKGIFIQCSRKWGKTESAIYMLWRWAMSNPNASCYYIAPLLNQAREIVWADPRLQSFGPREWLMDGSLGVNNTEMRLRFKNGAFIKVDGSDNYDKHRGTRPHILIYEEFKDHRKQFREIMRPNLSVYDAPEIFIGTPPEDLGDEDHNEFLLTAKEHREDPNKFFHQAPATENPHISKDWLEAEKKRLYDRGEGDVWEREYEAKFVKGGARKIFPMLNKLVVRPHKEVLKEIERDKRKLEWFVWADPAGASCFAILFIALNPYTKKWYALDEIYEESQAEMTVAKVGKRLLTIRDELFVDRYNKWRQGYDEAETWFANEMLSHFNEHFEPTQKSRTDKMTGLSLIKDILLQGKLVVSDRCEKFYWELDCYQKDSAGKIPKKSDHLIDDFRYCLQASYYSLNEEFEKKPEKDEMWRGATVQDDFPALRDNEWGVE